MGRSEWLRVESSRDGGVWAQEYERGKPTGPVTRVGPQGDRVGTKTQFRADPEVFESTDYSFDNFGSGGVAELRCASVRLTNWLPEGTDCSSHQGEGFRSESLPHRT